MVDLNTVVLGIGINIKPQEHSPDTATSLEELGLKLGKDKLLLAIATELKKLLVPPYRRPRNRHSPISGRASDSLRDFGYEGQS